MPRCSLYSINISIDNINIRVYIEQDTGFHGQPWVMSRTSKATFPKMSQTRKINEYTRM